MNTGIIVMQPTYGSDKALAIARAYAANNLARTPLPPPVHCKGRLHGV